MWTNILSIDTEILMARKFLLLLRKKIRWSLTFTFVLYGGWSEKINSARSPEKYVKFALDKPEFRLFPILASSVWSFECNNFFAGRV